MTTITFPLILFLLPLAYSPGPGNMFFAANGARFGVRATWPASLGYHVATWLVTAAIGFGFLDLSTRFAAGFVILKWLGSLYVLWLAWVFWRAGESPQAQTALPPRFLNGVVLLVLNPKAYVIIALMFTQFLHPTQDGPGMILFITTLFTLNNLIAFSLWTALGDQITRQFRSPHSARLLNRLFAVLLTSIALWMSLG